MQPILPASELAALLTTTDFVVVDARSGPDAFSRYSAAHLPGAVYVDLDKDLSQKKTDAADGGRHPLPELSFFATVLGKSGIGKATRVLVYDDKGGANAAARFWWMLKAVGHKNVQVLDGGINAAAKAGIELSSEIPAIKTLPPYPVQAWTSGLADINAVADAVNDPAKLVIDVREAYRYLGESEPIDLVAGHIPGAVNIPYTGNMDAEGNFLSVAALAEKYKEVIGNRKPQQVIVHCGSGVTACHTLLALEQAGISDVNLYVGSWSEWSRNKRSQATGNG